MQRQNEASFATRQYLSCIKLLSIFLPCSGRSRVQVADLFIQTCCGAAQTKWKLLQSHWVWSIKGSENRPPPFIPHFLKRNTFFMLTRFPFTLTEAQSLFLHFYRHAVLLTATICFELGISLLWKPTIFLQDGQWPVNLTARKFFSNHSKKPSRNCIEKLIWENLLVSILLLTDFEEVRMCVFALFGFFFK